MHTIHYFIKTDEEIYEDKIKCKNNVCYIYEQIIMKYRYEREIEKDKREKSEQSRTEREKQELRRELE